MKILFVGSLTEGQTSLMRMNVLKELGFDLTPLSTQIYWDRANMLARRAGQSIGFGPIVDKINAELLDAVISTKPDLVWAEKQEYFKPEVLRKISALGVKLIHYTPDPYFSLSWKRTKLLDACLPLYDCLITSKRYELNDYRKVNENVIYMQLGYSEEVHRPFSFEDQLTNNSYLSDVSFIGGWEPRREEYLDAVAQNIDCSLKIWGYGWDYLKDGHWTPRRWWSMRRNAGGKNFKIKKNLILGQAVQGNEIYGNHYARALSAAKINIGFLREICPDEHTTRSFEIPACKSLLLADRSNEHSELFIEGKEADYFASKDEMLDKIKFYLANKEIREKIAISGYERCIKSGYSYKVILKNAVD